MVFREWHNLLGGHGSEHHQQSQEGSDVEGRCGNQRYWQGGGHHCWLDSRWGRRKMAITIKLAPTFVLTAWAEIKDAEWLMDLIFYRKYLLDWPGLWCDRGGQTEWLLPLCCHFPGPGQTQSHNCPPSERVRLLARRLILLSVIMLL